MDPAQEFEAKMLLRQQPMNDVIERGDSAVQEFYRGATVFVTGGSGFLGKQLVEKLFRACKLKKMFLLLRPKKGKSMQERLDYMLQDSAFDLVRGKRPRFADKIVPVSGDVADVRLGLSDADWATITAEVDIVIHMAATIRFDEPLNVATLTNVRGTRETLELAKNCKKLRNYVYVSTAYSQATEERIGKDVLEQFYPCPVAPNVMIAMAERMDVARLNGITPELTKGWPNTYAFTKAIAEEMVRIYAADLPVCVVRPPIVVGGYREPMPGWLDMSSVMGPSGILVGVALGIMHVFFVDIHKGLALTPVDLVNNAIITAAWDSMDRRKITNEVPIYTVTDKEMFIKWELARDVMNNSRELASVKAVWYCYLIETSNKLKYFLLTWLIHYIPAYLLDGVCAVLPFRAKGIPPFISIYTKIDKLSFIYRYFLSNSWQFGNENLKSMLDSMSDTDRAIFNFDMKKVSKPDLLKIWLIGVRKYILKDGLKDSAVAVKNQKLFYIANCFIFVLYFYIWWTLFSVFWAVLNYMF
nr:fatty acyl-CoA reductase wat [Helicoverpa armigera]